MSGLETTDGVLRTAKFPGVSGAMIDDPAALSLDAITDASGNVVAVYFAADGALELHEIPRVIHALQCALKPYGEGSGSDPGPTTNHTNRSTT